ncbi:MAG: YcgL domain-containing protein [Saccharospirillum sp.]|nr:YcgL domain-containing protein [Saccharospirillum sp.]
MTRTNERVMVSIYRSMRRAEMYLYLPRSASLSDLPEALLKQFGEARKITDMLLTPDRKLARADTNRVLEQLIDPGYYLQMPPADTENLLDAMRREQASGSSRADV